MMATIRVMMRPGPTLQGRRSEEIVTKSLSGLSLRIESDSDADPEDSPSQAGRT
jgi:hypothetical protein